jgi:uncharacterized protein (TIGR02466 family)
MAEIGRLFSTPVGLEMVDRLIDLDALRKAVSEEQARDPAGIVKSNVGGWHSATTLQHWGGPAALALGMRAAAIADSMTFNELTPDAPSNSWNADMWANVATAGNFHQAHVHLGCVWSGVVYLDDGYDGHAAADLGGELVLTDPRMPQIRMNAPYLGLREGDGKPQPIEFVIRPRTGLMVIFPGWLLHAVRPFSGAGKRVSVAFNLKAG